MAGVKLKAKYAGGAGAVKDTGCDCTWANVVMTGATVPRVAGTLTATWLPETPTNAATPTSPATEMTVIPAFFADLGRCDPAPR